MPTAQEILKQYFGYDSFRPGQDELVQAILSGRDRRRQVHLLSGPGARAARTDARHLAAHLADEGPGRRAE